MKTWKMNLLDNRSDKKGEISDKFNFCKEKGIVGIGWVGYEEIGLSQDDKEFKTFKSAKSKLEQFDEGDLVWVKVPKELKLWLCVVKSKMIKTDDEEYKENDVGYYCECEYIREFSSNDLPKKLPYESLTTRSAISSAVDQINDATNNIYQKLIKKKKSIKELFSDILKNIKKYWYIYMAALMLIIAAIVTISIFNASKAAKVNEYIDGKIFISIDSDRDYKAFSFSDGKIAIEEGFSYSPNSDEDGHIAGDITKLSNKYKVSASIFSDKIWIMTKYPHGYIRTVAVFVENGVVKKYKHTEGTPEWKEVTLEELEKYRKQECICNHAYSEWNITKEVTITTTGQKERTCSKCNRFETIEFDYSSALKPTIKDLEQRILQANSDLELNKKQTGISTIYSVGYPKFVLTVPNENNNQALVLEEYMGSGINLILSTSTNTNGNISWVCVQENFEFGDYFYRNTLIPYVFGDEYLSSDPLNLETVMDFINKSDKSVENGWNIYEYEAGGITYKLKSNKTGFYFYIYF